METSTEKKKQADRDLWRELTARKEEFSKIVKLLVEFDEKTGRYLKYNHPETHYMRRAVAACDPENLRIFLKSLGGFVYSVVAEVKSAAGLTATAWVHEDGIRQEREGCDAGHPVHQIVCVTDLFEADSQAIDVVHSCVSQPAADLLAERGE